MSTTTPTPVVRASVWEAVKIVAVADIVMSLDNVLAIAAAAGGHTGLIILGLVISIAWAEETRNKSLTSLTTQILTTVKA